MANPLSNILKAITKPAKEEIKSEMRSFMSEWTNSPSQTTGGSSWLSPWGNYNNYSTTLPFGELDLKVSPQVLVETCRDSVVAPVSLLIYQSLTRKGWGFMGGKNATATLKRILSEAKFNEIWLPEWFEGAMRTGGGNTLTIIEHGLKGLRLRVEPFNADGYSRVQVYGDNRTRTITKYEVVDSARREISTFTPDEVYHDKLFTDGDYRFGSSPSIWAARFYVVKKNIMAGMQTSFEDMKYRKRYGQPSLEFLKSLTSDSATKGFKSNWDQLRPYLEQQAGMFATDLPMDFKDMLIPPKEMGAFELLKYIDENIGAVYLTGLSVLGRSEGINRSNSEQNRDDVSELMVEPLKRRIERIVMDFIMPTLVPNYDKLKNPFYFGREITQEEIEQYRAKTERVKAQSEVLATISTIPGYKLDLETMVIVEDEAPQQQGNSTTTDEQQIEQSVEEDDNVERAIKTAENNTFFRDSINKEEAKGADIEAYLKSKAVGKLKKRLEKALTEQIKNYANDSIAGTE
jgi:hypothetical protein